MIEPPCDLVGDPQGIAQLKALHAKDKESMKFLVGEAKSNTDLTAPFVGGDGVRYMLKVEHHDRGSPGRAQGPAVAVPRLLPLR